MILTLNTFLQIFKHLDLTEKEMIDLYSKNLEYGSADYIEIDPIDLEYIMEDIAKIKEGKNENR